MDEICKKLFTGTRFSLNEYGRVRARDIQRQLDRTTDRRCLTDDLTLPLVQFAAKPHDLSRELVSLEGGADLVGDALDERDVVLFKGRLFAPNKSEKTEGVTANLHGRA